MPEIIDLSHPIEMNMPVYPGTDPPVIKEMCTVKTHGFKESQITFFTHVGTHLDVPAHLFHRGKTIDKFDSNHFFGSGILIDCTTRSEIDLKTVRDAYTQADLPDYLLFHTGWDKWWCKKQYFSDFPVMTNEAADYLSAMPIKGIGIDAISYDPVGDNLLYNHKAFLKQNIIMVENLCSLENLLGKHFQFSCLPLNITRADGAPTRAFALINKK